MSADQQNLPTIIDLFAQEKHMTRDDLVSMIVNHLAPKDRSGAPLATKADTIMFLQIARRFDLDPFAGEIYMIPSQRGIKTYIPIDGYTKIATRHPDYDGCDIGIDWQDDKPVACTVTIFRKNHSHPTRVTEYLVECARDTAPWRTAPARMLRHKAYIQAIRVAFGISAAMSEEDDAPAAPVVTLEKTVSKPVTPPQPATRRPPPPPQRVNGNEAPKEAPVTIEAEPVKQEPFDMERFVDTVTAGLKASKSKADIAMLWENMQVDDILESAGDDEATSLVTQLRAKAEKRLSSAGA